MKITNKSLKILNILEMCTFLLYVLLCPLAAQTPDYVKWTNSIIADNAPAIAPDGTIYICTSGLSSGNFLYALNPTGTRKWGLIVKTEGGVPVVGADGTVYIGGYFGNDLCAIDPDGTVKWVLEDITEEIPAIASDGTIYCGGGGNLNAVNPDSTIKWQYAVGTFNSSPVIGANGTIYFVGGENQKLTAVNAGGNLMWQSSEDSLGRSSLAIGSDKTVLAASINTNLYAFNSDNGSLKWQFNLGCPISRYASPVVGPNGTIYVTRTEGFLRAINPDGSLKWPKDAGTFESSAAIGADGNVYIASYWAILIINSEDGSSTKFLRDPDRSALFEIGRGTCFINSVRNLSFSSWLGSERSSVALSPDGTLYVGSKYNSKVYAIQTGSNGLANSPWPKFRADNQNTGRASSDITFVAQKEEKSIPTDYSLFQNYPNPFNPETEIRFALPRDSHVFLRIYNTLGQEIRTLANSDYATGFHLLHWNGKDNFGKDVASGVYLYKLEAGEFSEVKKMSLVR